MNCMPLVLPEEYAEMCECVSEPKASNTPYKLSKFTKELPLILPLYYYIPYHTIPYLLRYQGTKVGTIQYRRIYHTTYRKYHLNTEDKQQLKVWISSSCIERLRRHITRKYPNFKKGWLSIEVENFINQGIAAFKRQTADEMHTHTLPERTYFHNHTILFVYD